MVRVGRKIESSVGTATPVRLIPWLRRLASDYGDRPALVAGSGSSSPGTCVSFADLDRQSAALAGGLHRLGLRRGDAVAIFLPNRPEWMVLQFAAARLGLLTIPINTWCRESEVTHYLSISRCKAVAIAPGFKGIDFVGTLNAAIKAARDNGIDAMRWVIGMSGGDSPTLDGVRTVPIAELLLGPAVDAEDADNEAVIAYSTSGTTSAPKLAVHGEHSLLSHAAAVARDAQMSSSDVVLGALAPCGAYGYGLIVAALSIGARTVLCEEFNLDEVMKTIATERISMLALTEPLLRRMLDHPLASRATFQSLRIVYSAGGTLQSVVARAESEFGFRISNVYGSSEILALAAVWPFDVGVDERSVGGGRLVSPGMRVRAVDSSGKALPTRGKGELQFSGPALSNGYLGNERATSSTFSTDGWFSSKDLGYVLDDEGRQFVYISRMDDAIRLKGFLVSPGEIEQMLQTHPDVLSAQVVGIPDGKGEEIAAAFVIAKDGQTLHRDALRDFCRQHMASYKIPAIVQIVTEYPVTKSANGDKVMKNRLRDMAKEIETT